MKCYREYAEKILLFREVCKTLESENIYPHSQEAFFEAIADWSQFMSIGDVREWFIRKRDECDMTVVDIPMKDLRGWDINESTGDISHTSGDFFTIHGVRVTTTKRETSNGWDQPVLEQVGRDGGFLGLIRKRFNGVPHYLCEAKAEPGNYGRVQLSPTLQATFANINMAHGGRQPHFTELFVNRKTAKKINVLFEAWLAEDGGRLHLKRNFAMLVEVDEDLEIELPNPNFIWLSLFQIKTLLLEDSWINPHVRSILAHV